MNVRQMPATAYQRAVTIIRDQPRVKREAERLRIDISRAERAGRDTSIEKEDLEEAERFLDAIQEVLDSCVDSDMQQGIMDNIIYRISFPRNEYAQMVPSRNTWQRSKKIFIAQIAHKFRVYPTRRR